MGLSRLQGKKRKKSREFSIRVTPAVTSLGKAPTVNIVSCWMGEYVE